MSVNGKGNGNEIEKGPQEMERLRAMLDFKKNVKPGEYIDQDIYGREDSRVLSGITSTGEERSNTQTQLVKGTGPRHTRKVQFVSASLIGKKARSLLRKLTKTMDCFGTNSSESNEMESGEHVVSRPDTASNQPSALQVEPNSSNDKRLVGSDTVTAGQQPTETLKEHHVGHVEIRDEQDEEDTGRNVDATPHRVKSRVGSGDDLSVVERGTVMKTLSKLRSTGSFVFNEARSIASKDGNINDGKVHADSDECMVSKDSGGGCQESSTVPSKEELKSQKGSQRLQEDSGSSWNGSASVREQIVTVEEIPFVETAHIAAEHVVSTGSVRRLRSVFGESAEFKSVGSPLKLEASDVPDNVVVRRASSVLKVTALTLGANPVDKDTKNVSELQKSETASDIEGAEQPALLSVQELSKHLSGRVHEMKSLFESRSEETVIGNDCGEDSKSDAYHIRNGLSCDSGAFSSVGDNDIGTFKLEVQTTVEDAKEEDAGAKTSKASEANKSINTAEVDEKQVRDTTIIQVVGDYVDMGGGAKQTEGDDAVDISELEEGEVPTTEPASETNRSSGQSSHVDVIDESSSGSVASSDGVSQPASHLVASCLLM